MGIETLYNAAYAAGFAMAAPEEDESFDLGADAGVDLAVETGAAHAPWQPSNAVLVRAPAAEKTDWASLVLGLFRRRAPVRRPALTVEA